MEVVCQWCGQVMETRDLRRKYHTVNKDGVFCSYEARLECKRQHERERRKKGFNKLKPGTGLLGPHRYDDHEKEAREILKEKRWLRLEVRYS